MAIIKNKIKYPFLLCLYGTCKSYGLSSICIINISFSISIDIYIINAHLLYTHNHFTCTFGKITYNLSVIFQSYLKYT